MWQRRLIADQVQGAVAIATLSAQFTAHQAACIEDKAEIKQQLASQDATSLRMHKENQEKLAELAKANRWVQRSVWMAAGAILALKFFLENGIADVVKAMAGMH